jgi:hypothetical protein
MRLKINESLENVYKLKTGNELSSRDFYKP